MNNEKQVNDLNVKEGDEITYLYKGCPFNKPGTRTGTVRTASGRWVMIVQLSGPYTVYNDRITHINGKPTGN